MTEDFKNNPYYKLAQKAALLNGYKVIGFRSAKKGETAFNFCNNKGDIYLDLYVPNSLRFRKDCIFSAKEDYDGINSWIVEKIPELELVAGDIIKISCGDMSIEYEKKAPDTSIKEELLALRAKYVEKTGINIEYITFGKDDLCRDSVKIEGTAT